MLCSCWSHQASTLSVFPPCLVQAATVDMLKHPSKVIPVVESSCCFGRQALLLCILKQAWLGHLHLLVQGFSINWLLCKLSKYVHLCNGPHVLSLCRFWYFLTVQGVLGTWALLDAISAWNLHPQLKHGLLPGFQVFFASVALFLISLFDWGLWIFHTFLLATGRTTNEHVYRRNGPVAYLQHVPRKVSAFDQGIVKNVYNVFCAREAVVYRLPPRAQLIESAQIETVWDNRYYSCCR